MPQGLERIQRNCMGLGEGADGDAPERRHMADGPQRLGEVPGEAAHIGALAGQDLENRMVAVGPLDQLEALDQDLPRGQIDGLPGPGQVIGALAGHLERRIDRRALLDPAAKGRKVRPGLPRLPAAGRWWR